LARIYPARHSVTLLAFSEAQLSPCAKACFWSDFYRLLGSASKDGMARIIDHVHSKEPTMSSFPGSPRLLKGGIVLLDPQNWRCSARDYAPVNPDTITRISGDWIGSHTIKHQPL